MSGTCYSQDPGLPRSVSSVPFGSSAAARASLLPPRKPLLGQSRRLRAGGNGQSVPRRTEDGEGSEQMGSPHVEGWAEGAAHKTILRLRRTDHQMTSGSKGVCVSFYGANKERGQPPPLYPSSEGCHSPSAAAGPEWITMEMFLILKAPPLPAAKTSYCLIVSCCQN